MSNPLHAGAFEVWPKPDQERFWSLYRKINDLKERVSPEDFTWFIGKYRVRRFYRNAKRRALLSRCHFSSKYKDRVMRGFNTGPR